MANEVIWKGYKAASAAQGLSSGVYGEPLAGAGATEDIATVVGPLVGDVCRLQANGAAFWLKHGSDNTVSAAAAGDDNVLIKDGDIYDFEITASSRYFDTAAA